MVVTKSNSLKFKQSQRHEYVQRASRTLLIATISPCARHAIHTRNTLEHATDMFNLSPRESKSALSNHTSKSSSSQECHELPRKLSPLVLMSLPLSDLCWTFGGPTVNEKEGTTNIPSLSEWSEDQVREWLDNISSGRFARLVLPEGMRDGKGLLKLESSSFTEMFAAETLRSARSREEGASWQIAGPNDHSNLARLLYNLVRNLEPSIEAKRCSLN